MALSREDHKRIALSIAEELRKVMSDANGKRLKDKAMGRMAPHAEPDGDEDADVLASLGDESLEGPPEDFENEPDGDEDAQALERIPQFRKRKK